MLIVSSGDIVFTRRMPPSEDCVYVIDARQLLLRLDGMDLDLHLALFRQIDRLDGAKYAVLVDCMNIIHGDNSLDYISFYFRRLFKSRFYSTTFGLGSPSR